MSEIWQDICNIEEIIPQSGVCALFEGKEIAIFRPSSAHQIFALSNLDPFFQASVLSRGLITEHQGDLWVASPLKKQHFRLKDGLCLEDEHHSVKIFAARVHNNIVQLCRTSPAEKPF